METVEDRFTIYREAKSPVLPSERAISISFQLQQLLVIAFSSSCKREHELLTTDIEPYRFAPPNYGNLCPSRHAMMHLDTRKGFVVLDPPGTVVLETDSLDGNEVRCVLRIPVHIQSIHAALIGGVEVRSFAGTSND